MAEPTGRVRTPELDRMRVIGLKPGIALSSKSQTGTKTGTSGGPVLLDVPKGPPPTPRYERRPTIDDPRKVLQERLRRQYMSKTTGEPEKK